MGAYIAVDIGGTGIRVAVYPEEGITPIRQERIATRGHEKVIDRIIGLIQKLWPDDRQVLAMGACLPGPIDPRAGILFNAPNIKGWDNLPIRQILQDQFHVPVVVGNDANMAAVGEWRYGAGVGHHNLVFLTISTGIGGGVILDDRLVLGERGLAAELGHITVIPDGPLCGCGHRGHIEAIASGTAIARYVAQELANGRCSTLKMDPPPTARDISHAAAEGDELSIEALTRAGKYLGQMIADYLHIFNPTMIIMGGGVSRSGPLLINPMREAINNGVISPSYLQDLVIAPAALGDDAGLLGTLAIARMQNLEHQLVPDD